MTLSEKWTKVLTALLLAGLLATLGIELDAPWQRIHEDNGAFFTAVASAHLIKGWARTRAQDFLVARNSGELEPYLHHPPLMGNVLALSFRLAGSSAPRVARLTVIAFHVTSFLLMAAVAQRVFGTDHAARLWAMFVFAVAPVSGYFGRVVVHEPFGLTFLLAFAWTVLRYLDSPSGRRLVPACASLALAGLTSWPSYFVALGLVIWAFVETRQRGRSLRGPGVLAATFAATLAFVCMHLLIAAGGSLTNQERSVSAWLGPGRNVAYVTGYLKALATALDFNRNYYGTIPALLALGWGLHRLYRLVRRRWDPSPEERFIAALGVGQILYILLFIKAVTIHAYHHLNLLPFAALASASVLNAARDRWRVRRRLLARALLPLAMLITGASAFYLMHYRYTKTSSYAMSTSRHLTQRYEIWPGETAPQQRDASRSVDLRRAEEPSGRGSGRTAETPTSDVASTLLSSRTLAFAK